MASLITGISGQDGSYLAEQLLAAGEHVTGVIYPREELPEYFTELKLASRCEMVGCDISDPHEFRSVLRASEPDKVFHLAAMSSPRVCEERPDESHQLNVTSVEVLIDWIRRDRPDSRALTVSSAAIFGQPAESPQTEETEKAPVNAYGRQKLEVLQLSQQAASDGLFVACAIPYNHESPRRREDFVIAKVVNSAVRISRGLQEPPLRLGNLAAQRDWGYAPEYVEAFNWMLEIERPQNIILATGECNSVGTAVKLAFEQLELDHAKLVDADGGSHAMAEASVSVGSPEKAWRELGWEPKVRFPRLIEILVEAAKARWNN